MTHSGRAFSWKSVIVVLVVASAMMLGIVAPAYAAALTQTPMITEAAYTNPVASELKSLQWTHFYGTFDRSVWAVLTIHDGSGREVAKIFDGAVPEANKRFWFPSWNGKDKAGKHLPSSVAYTWKLRVVRGGYEDVRTGKIAVCRVLFSIRGDGADSQLASAQMLFYDKYFVQGAGRVYVRAVDSGDVFFSVSIWSQSLNNTETHVGGWTGVASPLVGSAPFSLTSRGVRDVFVNTSNGTWFEITFMQ